MLTVSMKSYLTAFEGVYPLKTTKTGSKYDQLLRGCTCDLELKMELLKLLAAIQSKIFEVNLLMKGRI